MDISRKEFMKKAGTGALAIFGVGLFASDASARPKLPEVARERIPDHALEKLDNLPQGPPRGKKIPPAGWPNTVPEPDVHPDHGDIEALVKRAKRRAKN